MSSCPRKRAGVPCAFAGLLWPPKWRVSPMSTGTINPAPAPSSERRAAANRRNAQKSTGPRTPEGKARTALNALKHGVTARTPFIPSDDPDEFAELTCELLEDLD